MPGSDKLDWLIVGAGFFGIDMAVKIKTNDPSARILVVDAAGEAFSHASQINQARIHTGCHYPRSFKTAWRSSLNAPRFEQDFAPAVMNEFRKLYVIARHGSHVTPAQFIRFAKSIETPLSMVDQSIESLFNPYYAEGLFETRELAFNWAILRDIMLERAAAHKIPIQYNVSCNPGQIIVPSENIGLKSKSGSEWCVAPDNILWCTYAGLGQIEELRADIKYQIAELALVDLPPPLDQIGITVMDGPFFSTMPWPSKGCHSLTHVDYTVHKNWSADSTDRSPYEILGEFQPRSKYRFMINAAAKFVPSIAEARYRESKYALKALLLRSEQNDGRPILFDRSKNDPRSWFILGGKLDNIYDIEERFDEVFK